MAFIKRLFQNRNRYDILLNDFKRSCTKLSPHTCVTKYVYISQSNDIFVNLALEDWLYQNHDFSQEQILLLWRNTPAVVIGRHQNPWLEANIQQKDGLTLMVVRRNSGGGAVYHDLQNLNLSFLTSRKFYNRKHNLEIITKTIAEEWGIDCKINSREDIMYNGCKISGTASKLSKKNAYHHCTLLVDSNKLGMSDALHSNKKNIVTNATRSKPSKVMNLRELNSTVNVDRLMTAVGLRYVVTPPFMKSEQFRAVVESKGFHFVSPEESYFPGINEKIKQLRSWDWIFGRTPKFSIDISIPLSELSKSFSSSTDLVNMEIETENALIKTTNVVIPSPLAAVIKKEMLENLAKPLYKQKYSDELVSNFKDNVFNFLKNKLCLKF